jgi:hypothetical protein
LEPEHRLVELDVPGIDLDQAVVALVEVTGIDERDVKERRKHPFRAHDVLDGELRHLAKTATLAAQRVGLVLVKLVRQMADFRIDPK